MLPRLVSNSWAQEIRKLLRFERFGSCQLCHLIYQLSQLVNFRRIVQCAFELVKEKKLIYCDAHSLAKVFCTIYGN